FRLHRREGGFGFVERDDFGIDAVLAHAPRDQLRHLGAEIDDEDFVVHRAPCSFAGAAAHGIDPTAVRRRLVQRSGLSVKSSGVARMERSDPRDEVPGGRGPGLRFAPSRLLWPVQRTGGEYPWTSACAAAPP